MKNLSEIMEQEKAVANMIQQLKQEIVQEIKSTPIPGVRQLSPIVIVVQFSQIKNSDNWTAEFYVSDAQARVVEQALQSITTASAFHRRVSEILEKRVVRINNANYGINETTIHVLEKYI